MFAKNVVSIDIGTYYTKVVQGRVKGNGIYIENAQMFRTPADVMEDGRIKDLQELQGEFLNQLAGSKLKGSLATYSIVGPEVIIREIVLPTTNPKQIKAMLPYEVEKHFPIIMSDYIIQHIIHEEFQEADYTKKSRLLVAALPKEIAESYLALTNGLQLKPLALDIHGDSVARLLSKTKTVNNEEFNPQLTTAVIDIGYNYINCNIIFKGKLIFNRTSPAGGMGADVALAYAFDINPEEAQTEKLGATLGGELEDDDLIGAKRNLVIQGVVDEWIQEIQKIFRYYLSTKAGNKIEHIILYGGSSGIDGMANYMQEALNRPTQVIETLGDVTLAPSIKDIPLKYYLNAIGALIRD